MINAINNFRLSAFHFVFIGLCGSLFMFAITALGAGVSSDSITYLEAAQSFLNGDGFWVNGAPLVHFPPIFPLMLSWVSYLTQGDLLLSARILSAVSFGANLALILVAIGKCTKNNVAAIICGTLLFVFSAPIIPIHSMTWSEAPFLSLTLAGFLFLARFFVRPQLRYLVAAALILGLAAATRYVGLVLLPTIAIAMFTHNRGSLKKKWKDALVILLLAGLPLGIWLIRNLMIAESATNRSFFIHLVDLNHVKNLIRVMHDFIVPLPLPLLAKAVIVSLLSLLFIRAFLFVQKKSFIKKEALSFESILPSLLVLYSTCYILLLLVSISFFDADTLVNFRLLLPVYIAILIVATTTAKKLSDSRQKNWIWRGYIAFTFIVACVNIVPAANRAIDIHKNGKGFISHDWQNSDLLSLIAQLPASAKLYINWRPKVLRFLIDNKSALSIPQEKMAITHQRNIQFADQANQMVRECKDGSAYIVLFDNGNPSRYGNKRDLDVLLNGFPASRRKDGWIYGRQPMKGSN
ncbi:MAG: hypothetical protein HN844_03065 [Planctomycetes bacterium]|jgi:hypothetical protein|nr:hypothetical protein [Planctomycetota bacterium]